MTHRDPARGGVSPPRLVLDLDHLDRQTLCDKELEREVLTLFLQQLQTVRNDAACASPNEWTAMFHRLKGAALGVGAFDLAEKAERIESGLDPRLLHAFEAAAAEAASAVEAHMAGGVSQG